jgi:hypothetical protein
VGREDATASSRRRPWCVAHHVHHQSSSHFNLLRLFCDRPLFLFHPGDMGKRNYSGAFNCFARIAREEGYRAFYKVSPFHRPQSHESSQTFSREWVQVISGLQRPQYRCWLDYCHHSPVPFPTLNSAYHICYSHLATLHLTWLLF